MPETPFPHIEDLEHLGANPDSRIRRRPSMPGRSVSAFAPVPAKSDPPVSASATAPMIESSPPLSPDDFSYASTLRLAGIVSELHGAEITRIARHVVSSDKRARHLDLLFAYYAAGGDALVSRRRMVTDRWFIYSAKQSLTLGQVLGRLLGVLPEISAARLERVGGPEGTLVVRCGDHVCALEDEIEESPDCPTVSVAGLVRALNVLLDRQGVRARLIGLFGDGTREAYVGIASLASAVPLAQADFLSVTDAESLMEQTGW
ncbi:MAG: hypothetical protein QM778_10395 [Myxococcales bacterium]